MDGSAARRLSSAPLPQPQTWAGDWHCEVARIGERLDELSPAALEMVLVVIESLLEEEGMTGNQARGEARALLLGKAQASPRFIGRRGPIPLPVRLAPAIG